jgi:Cu(I)/Ag(I) efflux system membrane fusion protein
VPKPAASNAQRHRGEAKVEAINRDAITLSHGPIESIKWGSMTMDFKAPPAKDLPRNLEVGDRVAFEFYIDAEGLPQLTRVQPAAPQPRSRP